MRTLESYEVKRLDQNQLSEISGGSWFWQAAVATFAYNVVADWDENVAAFKEGMSIARNN